MAKNNYIHLLSSGKIISFLMVNCIAVFSNNMLCYFILFWGSYKLFDCNSIDVTWGLVVFLVFLFPLIILVGYGGYLANRFPSKVVFVIACLAEMINLILLGVALYYHNIHLSLVALGITTSITALIGPIKFSSIPDLVNEDEYLVLTH